MPSITESLRSAVRPAHTADATPAQVPANTEPTATSPVPAMDNTFVDQSAVGGAAPADLRPVGQRGAADAPGVVSGLDAILGRASVSDASFDPTLGVDTAVGETVVTVRSGDTLQRIANQHGVSLNALKNANPHLRRGRRNFGLIHVGDRVTIPGTGTANTVSDSAGTGQTAGAGGASNVSSTVGNSVPRLNRYAPHSTSAKALFREAAAIAGVPQNWATAPDLHTLLQKESDGWVGRPNYTYGRRSSLSHPGRWESVHDELRRGRITARSSATGLGQMTSSNASRLYPSGLAGIGDPMEEAVGMLKYIKERYRTPARALAFHRRNNWY